MHSGFSNFINGDFLLHSKTAQGLYHDYAAREPILDFHSHLPPGDIAADRRFQNLFEIWLEGDHYKWRAMRANGVGERYCTGEAPPYEKFLAWARTVPSTLRNPLYHWTHLELKRYFGIDALLDERSAASVWEQAATQLSTEPLTARAVLRKFDVRILCTSDDPCDSLHSHRTINQSQGAFRVYPTFRPDRALWVEDPATFNAWIRSLEEASHVGISSLPDLLDALRKRHDFFHAHGARLSDHGLLHCPLGRYSEAGAAAVFRKVRGGKIPTREEQADYASYLMLFFGRLDAEKGWTKQLHLGALRAVNTRRVRESGVESGYDATGDCPQARALCLYLDRLEQEHALPKTIVYNLNPADNYIVATALGSFQDGSVAGKIQFGSGWWFLDQKEGIEWQINALSGTGLLSRFVGMVTDSRSFMSLPRHEYFRRILCDLLGREVENGDLPNDEKLVGNVVRNICFENARQYLNLALAPSAAPSPVARQAPSSGDRL
ncbi:MAG TPA: glucuronate isomerase [Terriglobales bacterium]|nr:glucuronate isomerase [Terriglobales bacterium]